MQYKLIMPQQPYCILLALTWKKLNKNMLPLLW